MVTYRLEESTQDQYFLAFLEPHLGAASLATRGGRSRLMVFVHGGHGDRISTWTNHKAKAYWPELVRKDTANFGVMDVAVFDYYSPLWGDAKGVSEIAKILRARTAKAKVADYDEIIFVAHSLGGVVTRQYLVDLEEDKDPVLGKIRLVMSMTCAYGGSIVPDKLFEVGSKNDQFQDLSTESSFLSNLNAAWENLRKKGSPQQRFRPFVCSVRGNSDKIITRADAELGCDNIIIMKTPTGTIIVTHEHMELGKDAASNRHAKMEMLFPKHLPFAHPRSKLKNRLGHTDIVKPGNTDHVSHMALREAFRLSVSDS